MNRFKTFLLALTFSIGSASLLPAQDAAARIPRTSPSPSEPAPTPIGKAEESATPEPTPTAAAKAEVTPAPAETAAPPEQTPAAARETPAPAEQTPAGAEQTPVRKTEEKKEEAKDKTRTAPASSSRRNILREKPVRAVEPRAPSSRRPTIDDQSDNPGASRPTFDLSRRGDGNISAVVRRLENKWKAALRSHDVSAVSELLAADFVGTSSTGRVGSKSTLLSEIRKDKNVYKSLEARAMSVRTSSDDVAVVTGITKAIGTTKDGERFTTSRRFTDTWVKRNGQWRCIASQTTELPKG